MYGVGVGPGDPKMMTILAKEILESASILLAPTISMESSGRAEEVVRAILPNREIERIVFQMTRGTSGQTLRESSAKAAARELFERCAPDEDVAFVTLGDPSLYSTFYPLARAVSQLDNGVEISMVPGIPAFTYLACRVNMDLLDNSERLYVVAVVQDEDLDRLCDLLADRQATVVIYKCGRRFGKVREALAKTDRLSQALVGEQLGTQIERIVEASLVSEDYLSYFATVISPAIRSDFG
ncbi:precorrin-2 C(20)-methyltransferase [Acidithrix ferrooxidans]|uniref:Cobalt-precorrin-2 C(20)-methyltransferase n=1 Tax=Acidithrix ferrooxidans TaxID=1280514 RepID=A0A0D8HJI0_9ACTN|nr:precorrin-2 C(20)-methyltransferase [Acidithrix ferrooxidans]KJF18103.1 cobalt-precorrin-2 C(20)-methyltransferase [Acidithrix ferrooxidans]